MKWVVFSYSLPSSASTSRVTLWRRLRRLGAVSPTGSVYILPALDECVESFQWLAQEINHAGGEVLVMRVERFEGLDDSQVVELFNQDRAEAYDEIAKQLAELAGQLDGGGESSDLPGSLNKLQKQLGEIARIDYFQSPKGTAVAAELNRIRGLLSPGDGREPVIDSAVVGQYRAKEWVTRPRPHVDRLACAWLIRRFLNREAVIRYDGQLQGDDVGFDMEGGEFSHEGNLCTFEVMVRAFQLAEPGLDVLAEIVHEIDLRDGLYEQVETAGVDTVLRGWLLAGLPDETLEKFGLALFDGLYASLSRKSF